MGSEGAELAPPGQPPAPIAVPRDCHALAKGGETIDCGRAGGAPQDLLWVLRHGPGSAQGVDIYRVDGVRAFLALTADDPSGSSWEKVGVLAAGIGGPGGRAVVVTYQLGGTGGQLHVDVVGSIDGEPTVMFHRELDQGRVDTSGGVYRDWSAKFAPDDPNCCPSVFVAETVDYIGGRWRVGHHVEVPPYRVPAGQVP